MSNTRSITLRPVVSLLALLVVASLVVAAPASAGWPTHRAPSYARAVIALRATDHQSIAAERQATRVALRLRAAQHRLRHARVAERALRAELAAAAPATVPDVASVFLAAARERIGLQRSVMALRRDLSFTRALGGKARARRAVVLAGLSLEMRVRVLRADRTRQLRARALRLRTAVPTVLEVPSLGPVVAAGGNGAALAQQLDGTPAPAQAAASGPGAIAAAYALTQLGAPYRSAGFSPTTGFDCSGLVYWAFAQAGMAVPRSSWDIWRAGRHIPRAQAQPGDIVSFHGQGHVGIYLGDGLYVHSTKSGDVVRVHALADRHDLDGFVRLG